jgi:hypothetical protein
VKLRFLVGFGVAIVLASGCATEQSIDDPAETHFIKFYGRDGDQTGRDLVVLSDGTMVLFGTSRPTDDTDLASQWYVVRVDAKGAILWEQEFGGQQNEEARDIELTSAGNLVLVGNTYRSVDDRDVMIMTLNLATGQKIDSASNFVHDAVFANPFLDEDAATVTETTDGFIVAGSSTYVYPKGAVAGQTDSRDALQLRVNADLTIYAPTWSQTYGYYSDDYSVKIVPGSPAAYGSFYIFGSTNNKPNVSHPNFDYNYWMVVLGSNGGPLDNATYSGSTSGDERVSSHCVSPAGYFMAGMLESGAAPQDIYIVEAGLPDPIAGFGLLKEKNLSFNLGNGLKGATAVAVSPIGGGFLIVSEENGFNANQNWLLTRMNSNGTLAWNQPIVFGGEGLDEIGAVQELPDGRIVVIGTMRTGRPDVGEFKMTLVKVNKDGKFEK